MECIHLNFLTDNKGKKFLSPSLPNSDLNGKILKVIISDGSTKRVYPVFQQKAGERGWYGGSCGTCHLFLKV